MTKSNLNVIPDMWTHYEHPWYNQLNLLDGTMTSESRLPQKHKSETTGRKCTKCGQVKSLDSFSVDNSRSGWRRTECKQCFRRISRGLSKVKKTAPPKPNACQLCGDANRELVLDHCHHTETFRGWICARCNRGIGSFSDDISNLQQAILYLQNHLNGSQI